MEMPPVLAIAGAGGSGKTHLLERLLPRLVARGLRVGAVKHCGHVDLGMDDKDDARLARAGATPAVAASAHAAALRGACREPLLLDLVAAFCRGCDLVLAEGYARSVVDKVLLRRGNAPAKATTGVQLVVGDGPDAAFDRDDDVALDAWVAEWLARRRALRAGLVGVVLTGGASRRMGRDKAQLVLAGRSVLGRLCELLADRCGRVMIVGRAPRVDDLPLCAEWHPDRTPGQGPLGGILTALEIAAALNEAEHPSCAADPARVAQPPSAVANHGKRPAQPGAAVPHVTDAAQGWAARGICVVACDMPALGSEALDCLLAARDRSAPATVAVHPEGRLEPLLAVYEATAHAGLERALAAGRRSLTEWLNNAGAHRCAVPAHLAGQLANVNTPAELAALARDRREESEILRGRE